MLRTFLISVAVSAFYSVIDRLLLRARRKLLDQRRALLDKRSADLDSLSKNLTEWGENLQRSTEDFEKKVADLYSEGPMIAYKRAFMILRAGCSNPEMMDHVLGQCLEPHGPAN